MTTDTITTIPADDYLATRRRVDGNESTEYRYAEQATDTVFDTVDFAQVRVQHDGTISVMSGGRQFVGIDRMLNMVPAEGNDYIPGKVHSEFTPAQARALAVALITAAAEAEAV